MAGVNLENFLWLQAGLVLIGVVYLVRRAGPKGARFRWRKRGERVAPPELDLPPRQWQQPSSSLNGFAPAKERNLNVHFNYNGHSWDAYEVLGIPAGSGPEKVEEAYQKATSSADPESREFYAQARNAIQKRYQVPF